MSDGQNNQQINSADSANLSPTPNSNPVVRPRTPLPVRRVRARFEEARSRLPPLNLSRNLGREFNEGEDCESPAPDVAPRSVREASSSSLSQESENAQPDIIDLTADDDAHSPVPEQPTSPGPESDGTEDWPFSEQVWDIAARRFLDVLDDDFVERLRDAKHYVVWNRVIQELDTMEGREIKFELAACWRRNNPAD